MYKIIFLVFFILILGCTRPQLPKQLSPLATSTDPNRTYLNEFNCHWKFLRTNLCLNWHWETQPTSSDYGSLIIKTYYLSQFDKTPILDVPAGLIKLELFMPSMNHGSNPTETIVLDRGIFRIQDIYFIHSGAWELRFYLLQTDNQNVLDSIFIPFNF